MKPPYDITNKILHLVASISAQLGAADVLFLNKQSPKLRKQNRIKTIHASLQIEGNTLSEAQITALIDNKKVIGPEKDIVEVLNAIKVYDNLNTFDFLSDKSFLKAHNILMKGLVKDAGKYRTQGVGVVKGTSVAHIAPPHSNVPFLMQNLFKYLKKTDELILIKSCVFHYEMEFIHPFIDGNGRMGRLWQTLILMKKYPIFELLPLETIICETQKEYYEALSLSDKAGKSTIFIEYMLDVMHKALKKLLSFNNRTLTDIDRLEYFLQLGLKEFTRKNYMDTFKDISSATASRDLKKGLLLKLFKSVGTLNKTKYLTFK